MTVLAGFIVLGCGLFLIGLAIAVAVRPMSARRFLESFASSARTHYAEQVCRLVAGGAMVRFAPSMWYSDLFRVFGWILVVTAAGLLLVPWRWHHRFGRWAIPLATRNIRVFASGALLLGVFVLYGVSRAVLS